jgi:diguanylate cyclase
MQITYSAQHDVVTNLPNRILLNDRISQAIALARRQGRPIAVMFLDLDHFKYINDSLGHAAGDKLLQSISKRLLASLRGSDTVSRQGGDEFVILLSEIAFSQDAATSARKILLALNAAHVIDGQDLHIDGSIGVSVYPQDGQDAETLIKNADTAMYHAKECGRNNFQFFTAEMNLKAVHRQSIEVKLRGALERNEFVLHCQPKVNLDAGEITGVEALVRWQQAGGELVPPHNSYPSRKTAVLFSRLAVGCCAKRAGRRAAGRTGLPRMPIAVNVSAVEFRHKGFVDGVRDILSETGLEARYLELELTEGVLMDDAETTGTVLKDLKSMGIHLAVDDFGTGYSSLSYLRHFPIDVLKIDRSFVHQITANPDDSSIVSAIISMGKSLKHVVVAEGIETQEQWTYLQTQACGEGQGFLFSRPVAAHEFARLLRDWITEAAAH